jgi:hypothetical protein
MTSPSRSRTRTIATLAAAAVILIPCLVAFGNKLFELVQIYRSDPNGAFALAPVLNYLLASAGFLLLLLWAAANGMFRDVEKPKMALLEREQSLDSPSAASRSTP